MLSWLKLLPEGRHVSMEEWVGKGLIWWKASQNGNDGEKGHKEGFADTGKQPCHVWEPRRRKWLGLREAPKIAPWSNWHPIWEGWLAPRTAQMDTTFLPLHICFPAVWQVGKYCNFHIYRPQQDTIIWLNSCLKADLNIPFQMQHDSCHQILSIFLTPSCSGFLLTVSLAVCFTNALKEQANIIPVTSRKCKLKDI